MSKQNHKTAIESLYGKYEYMAAIYASKIFNFERYGYEKEDIVQELRIKIYTSIISYAEKWAEYKRTNRYKPVPIKFYIKAAMVNKVKDFIKLFNMEQVENIDKVSIQADGFDHSQFNTIESNLDINNCVCEINGVDLFEGLHGRKKQAFALFLKGFTIPELNERFTKIDVMTVVTRQIEFIRTKREELLDYKNTYYTMTTSPDTESH